MLRLVLRTKDIPGVGNFGTIEHNGQFVCRTVEKGWENNAPNVSCIPAGIYHVKLHDSPSKGKCFSLSNPNVGVTVYGPSQRTHCLIHSANYPNQLQGCIAPGLKFHNSKWGVMHSEDAMDILFDLIGDECELEIIRG